MTIEQSCSDRRRPSTLAEGVASPPSPSTVTDARDSAKEHRRHFSRREAPTPLELQRSGSLPRRRARCASSMAWQCIPDAMTVGAISSNEMHDGARHAQGDPFCSRATAGVSLAHVSGRRAPDTNAAHLFASTRVPRRLPPHTSHGSPRSLSSRMSESLDFARDVGRACSPASRR
jgi:hypothetical protein